MFNCLKLFWFMFDAKLNNKNSMFLSCNKKWRDMIKKKNKNVRRNEIWKSEISFNYKIRLLVKINLKIM